MSNPRKFSEKIALHNQKQAEETAAFEQIMREVSGATRAPVHITHAQAYQNQHLYINPPLGAYRGGSLPNVNQIGSNAIDLQNALDNLESIKQGQECINDRIHRERSRHMSHRNRMSHYEKRRDASPYETPMYLSPPADTSWRRTNSDSALHQSASTPLENSPLGSMNNLYMSNTCANNGLAAAHLRYGQSPTATNMDNHLLSDKQTLNSPASPHRPKSCEVPGINIFPSQEESTPSSSPSCTNNHMPISSSTGSLPDLTNLHFPSPLATPLDSEDHMNYTSINDPLHENQNALTAATSPLISHNNRQLPNNTMNMLNSEKSCEGQQQRHSLHNGIHITTNMTSHHLQQPQSPNNSRSSPSSETASKLSNLVIHSSKHCSDQLSSSAPMQYSAVLQPDALAQYAMYQDDVNMSTGTTHNVSGSYQVRSSSPGGTSSCSAPTSPVSPASSPGLDSLSYSKGSSPQNNFFVQTQQQTNSLQHQFEHFNMDQGSPTNSSMLNNGMYVDSRTARDNGSNSNAYMSASNTVMYNSNAIVNRLNHTTATGLPEIILTAPGAEEAMLRQDFVKDLGHAMASLSGSFDSELFAGADEALRAGLDPIDFDGLQILTDSDIPIDPATEETFRNDTL